MKQRVAVPDKRLRWRKVARQRGLKRKRENLLYLSPAFPARVTLAGLNVESSGVQQTVTQTCP